VTDLLLSVGGREERERVVKEQKQAEEAAKQSDLESNAHDFAAAFEMANNEAQRLQQINDNQQRDFEEKIRLANQAIAKAESVAVAKEAELKTIQEETANLTGRVSVAENRATSFEVELKQLKDNAARARDQLREEQKDVDDKVKKAAAKKRKADRELSVFKCKRQFRNCRSSCDNMCARLTCPSFRCLNDIKISCSGNVGLLTTMFVVATIACLVMWTVRSTLPPIVSQPVSTPTHVKEAASERPFTVAVEQDALPEDFLAEMAPLLHSSRPLHLLQVPTVVAGRSNNQAAVAHIAHRPSPLPLSICVLRAGADCSSFLRTLKLCRTHPGSVCWSLIFLTRSQ